MDAKDLRTESAVSSRNNDGTKFSAGGASLQAHTNKQYQDISSNSLGKVDVPSAPARPCAVIGPDRVVPPPVATDTYLKKAPLESWLNMDNSYRRPPDYPLKLTDYQHPSRNISPRQTFQENMQRIMVPPSYNTAKLKEDHNFPVDANMSPLRNNKLNVPGEAKYCEVPYTVNPMTNEQKNLRSADISVSNMNPVLARSAHGWSSGAANVRPAKPYGAHPEVYQYPDYPSCAGPRPMLMTRHRTVHEEPGPVYSDPYYHDRFKPYPSVKERYPQQRYDYINYSNPFHPPPPFPTHKYDPQKPIPPNIYPGYSQVPLKYLDPRMAEHVMNGYQRPSSQQGNFNNVQFRNQVIQSPYGSVPGNSLPNKFYSYPPEGPVKQIPSNKMPFDINNKMYVEYENTRVKNYPMSESFYVNEMSRHPMKGPVLSPSCASINMHSLPPHPYYRKENPNPLMKNYDYSPHFRNVDPSMNMQRLSTQYSLNSFAISPSDSSTSNDTNQTHGTSQEDCGYVSQSSTVSIRSMDSSVNRLPNDPYRRYDYRYGPIVRTSRLSRPEPNPSGNDGSKDKKNIDVRQFLQMWNEGEDEGGDNNNKVTAKAVFNNASDMVKQHEASNHEQLYVLGLVNVPSEELGKYEHIQKVSKLPENIKGYNNIELLNQFEEVIESSNLNNYNMKPPTRDFNVSLKNSISMHSLGIPPRPISPLDVEAKISQSVIHKEVGCNFEIRPCSPKMLNVEIAAPIHTVVDERVIEKVTNPLNIQSPMLHNVTEDNIDKMTNVIKHQDRRIISNDNTKVNSCKMINPQFSGSSHVDHVKGNYTMQDLESNAGICLASLPRLDNDCELNFPEVNQQFINANKVESVITQTPSKDLPALDVDQCDTVTKDQNEQETDCQFSPSIDLGKELPKLSKYRKHKRKLPDINENNSVLNYHVMRTDSVIIKNPDNIKSQEDSPKNKSPLNNFTEHGPHSPINLTVNTDARVNDNGNNKTVDVIEKPNEFAIDFSLNSTELYGYKSKSDAMQKNVERDVKLNDYSFISDEKHVDEKEMTESNLAQTDENNCFSVETCKENLNDYITPMIPKVNQLKNCDELKISEKNCNTGKSYEDNFNNTYIPEDLKKVSTCDESVINFNSDTVSEIKKVESPSIIYNAENDAMTMLLCETTSRSVQYESNNLNSESVKETTLNNKKVNVNGSIEENLKTQNEDKPQVTHDSSMNPKKDPTIDIPVIIHHHKSEPFDEDSLSQKVSKNVMSPVHQSHNDLTKVSITYSVTDHFSLGKVLDQGGKNDSNQKELNSANTNDFYDNMDVEHKMESLFSGKNGNVNEIDPPKELVCMEEAEIKSDSDILKRKISDVHSNAPHNLLCEKLPENEELIPRGTKRYVSKELFSPWIQKLILNGEGLCHRASNLNIKLNLKPKMDCTFSTVNNFLTKTTPAASKATPLPGKIVEYISECLETQSANTGLTKKVLENSITDSWSDESSDDDTDDTYSDTLNELEDHYYVNKKNEKSCVYASTFDKVEIDSCSVHEPRLKVDLKSEIFPIKEPINPVNETALIDGCKVLHEQDNTNSDIDDTIADVESVEKMSAAIKSSISDEPQTSSDEIQTSSNKLQTSSDELETNSNNEKSVVLPKNISPDIKLSISDMAQTSSDKLQTSSDEIVTNSNKLETNSSVLKTLNKVETVFESVSENVHQLGVDGFICKPVLCNLDLVRHDKTIVDDIMCKPNIDTTKTELCVPFIDSMINEPNTEIVKPFSLIDAIDSTQKAKTIQLEIKNIQENCENKLLELEALESNNDTGINTGSSIIENNVTSENPVSDSVLDKMLYFEIDHLTSTKENINSSALSETELTAENIYDTQISTNMNNLNDTKLSTSHSDVDLGMPTTTIAEEKFNCLDDIPETGRVCITVNEDESKYHNEDERTCEESIHDATIETSSTSVKEFNLKDEENVTPNATLNDSNVGNTANNFNLFKNKYSTRKQILKRSYSESALDEYSLSMRENSKLDDSDTNFLIFPSKRKKMVNNENCIEQLTSENYCNIIQNNRRNSISTICDQNISFCILIEDNCIITEDGEESEKICFTEISEECLPGAHNSVTDDDDDDDNGGGEFAEKITELISVQETVTSEYTNTFISDYVEDKPLDVSWVEDVACVETVVIDDIAEDVVISASVSPRDNDSSDYESNNDESGIFSLNEHTDKLKYIYGDKMCSDDAQLVETLYRTPQMDVNKTLVHKESQISEDGHRYYDEDSLERVLSESNNCEIKSYESNSIVEFTSSLCLTGFVASDKTPDDNVENVDLDNFDDNSLPFGIKNVHCNMECEKPEEKIAPYSPMFEKKTQHDTAHSCESSIDNVFSYNQSEDSPKYVISNSSEVSSTTSEDRNSNLYLKITKFRETSTAQVNDFNSGGSISCKYTEKEDCLYSNSKLPSRPLVTKAAQKYIPPLKDTIRDLKVKLPLPQNSLKKLKQLKISKEEPKPNINVNKHDFIKVFKNEIPKKPKPKFEDVLKSIDEIQFKKHKENIKKPKKIIPKVVIKKSENGSHYASTSNKDKFNPDLTGRKWQPWVFLEKNNFIDKMALKRKTKAIYSHRKNTYVLAEKFQKYKSISSAKFVISQPKLNVSSPGQLKYTIRLKHTY